MNFESFKKKLILKEQIDKEELEYDELIKNYSFGVNDISVIKYEFHLKKGGAAGVRDADRRVIKYIFAALDFLKKRKKSKINRMKKKFNSIK